MMKKKIVVGPIFYPWGSVKNFCVLQILGSQLRQSELIALKINESKKLWQKWEGLKKF